MRFKYLIASAIAIVGVAAYTLTLSFTQTTLLMSQIEALANGEGGESGDGGGTGEETGGENPESGESKELGLKTQTQMYCQRYGWTIDGDLLPIGKPGYFPVVICNRGKGICTPSNPCEIEPRP